MKTRAITILIAEDDADDRLLTMEALEENRLANDLHFVEDGEDLLQYLHQTGKYTPETAPRPGLILLDLNMPKMDGREALKILKADQRLKQIPVVVLTTSEAEEDVLKSYDLGVNSFITKPVTFERLVEVIRKLGDYWFGIVELPKNKTKE